MLAYWVKIIKSSTIFLFFPQFIRFVKKISEGDVTIKDNEVIEKSVVDDVDKSEEWANEFAKSQDTLPNSQQVLNQCNDLVL